MSEEKATGTAARPALKVGGLYKVTNPTSEHFGKVGALRSVVSYADGLDIPGPKRPLWIEFTDRMGLHHYHPQDAFARDDVEPYESEDTEPQALVSTHADGQIEQLMQAVNDVQTNQAEHAAHLDRLEHRTDALRSSAAADRLLIRKNAEQVKAAAENTGAVLADIMGRLETLEVKDIQRSADPATANKAADRLAQSSKDLWRKVWKIEEAIDAMKYRRMVGNMFRRVGDLVDGG